MARTLADPEPVWLEFSDAWVMTKVMSRQMVPANSNGALHDGATLAAIFRNAPWKHETTDNQKTGIQWHFIGLFAIPVDTNSDQIPALFVSLVNRRSSA